MKNAFTVSPQCRRENTTKARQLHQCTENTLGTKNLELPVNETILQNLHSANARSELHAIQIERKERIRRRKKQSVLFFCCRGNSNGNVDAKKSKSMLRCRLVESNGGPFLPTPPYFLLPPP